MTKRLPINKPGTNGASELSGFFLKPMESRKVYLGRFRTGQAVPDFKITWHPRDAARFVNCLDCPVEQGDGTYILYRQFQNFDAQLCFIEIESLKEHGRG